MKNVTGLIPKKVYISLAGKLLPLGLMESNMKILKMLFRLFKIDLIV